MNDMEEIHGANQVEGEQDQDGGLSQAAGQALEGMGKAFVALMLMLVIVIARILQALFTLMRPALLIGCVVLAGFGGVKLFVASYTAFGGDAPAALVAALSVIVVPAGLLVLGGDYGIWAVLGASGVVSWCAAELVARSPPTLLVASIPVVVGAVFAYFANKERKVKDE